MTTPKVFYSGWAKESLEYGGSKSALRYEVVPYGWQNDSFK